MTRHPILYSFIFVFIVFAVLAVVFFFLAGISSGERARIFSFGNVAVLKIDGPIFDSTDFLKDLHRYEKNDSVRAIVLRIDSPGGAVAPSQEIFEEVKKAGKNKKIVVSMGTVAASGAYYVASAGHKIFASPGTITGSIGVIMESFDLKELVRWARLENRVIKSGEYKDIGSPFRGMTPKEKAYLQNLLDNMYSQFKKAVSEQRKIPPEKMDEIAEGKIYTGEQALALGLVDRLGTVYDAINEAKKLAGLPESAHVIWPREEKFPLSWLFSSEKGKANSLLGFVKKNFRGFDFPVWLYSLHMEGPQI